MIIDCNTEIVQDELSDDQSKTAMKSLHYNLPNFAWIILRVQNLHCILRPKIILRNNTV